MSACIGPHGEYSEHEVTTTPFTCDLCGAFDQDAAVAEIESLRKAKARRMARHDLYRDLMAEERTSANLRAQLEYERANERRREEHYRAEHREYLERVEVERDTLTAQVEKVRALHQPWDDGPQAYCTHDREAWPCPTTRALGPR